MEKLKNALNVLKNGDFIHDYVYWDDVDIDNINFEQIVINYYKSNDSDINLDNFKIVTIKNYNVNIDLDFYYELFLDFKKNFNLFIKFNNYLRRSFIENVDANEKILVNYYITQYAFLFKFFLDYQKLDKNNYIKLLTILDNIEYNIENSFTNSQYKSIIVKNYIHLYEKFVLNNDKSYFESDEKNMKYYNYLTKTANENYKDIDYILYPPEKKIRNCSILKEEECAEECERIEQGSFFAWTGITKKTIKCTNRSDIKEIFKKSIENLSRKELIIFLCGYEQYENEELFYEIEYDEKIYFDNELIQYAKDFIDNGLNQSYPENIITDLIKKNHITNIIFFRIVGYILTHIYHFIYGNNSLNFFDMYLFFTKILEKYEYIDYIDKKDLFYICLFNFIPIIYNHEFSSSFLKYLIDKINYDIDYFYEKNKILIDIPFNFDGIYKLSDYDIINNNITLQNLYKSLNKSFDKKMILNMLSEYSFDINDYKYELIKCLDQNFNHEWSDTFPINVYLETLKNIDIYDPKIEYEYVDLEISKIKYYSLYNGNNYLHEPQNYCSDLIDKDDLLETLKYNALKFYTLIPVVLKIENDYVVIKNHKYLYRDNVYGKMSTIVKLIKNYDDIDSTYTSFGPIKINVETITTKPILQCVITQLYNNNSKFSFYDKKNIKSICIVSDESVNTDYFKKILGEHFTYHNVAMRNCEIISSYFYKKTKKCDDNKDPNTNFEKLYKFDYDFYILYNNPVVPDNFYNIINNESTLKDSKEVIYDKDKYFRYNRRDYIKINDDKNNKILNFVDDYITLNLMDYHHLLALKLLIFKNKYISKYDLDYSKKHLNWYLNQNSYYSIFYSFFYSKLNYPKNTKLKNFIDYSVYYFKKNNEINLDYKVDKNNTPDIFRNIFKNNEKYMYYMDKNFIHNKELGLYLYLKEINNEICVFELKISDKKISIIKIDLNNIGNDENNIIFNYYLFTGIKNEYFDFFEKMINKNDKYDLDIYKLNKNKNYVIEVENNLFFENTYIYNIVDNIKYDFNLSIFITKYPNINLLNDDILKDINKKEYRLYYDPIHFYNKLNMMNYDMINEKLNLNISMEKIIQKDDDVFKLLEYYNLNKIQIDQSINLIGVKFDDNIEFLLYLNNIENLFKNTTLNIYIFITANLIDILYGDNIIYINQLYIEMMNNQLL